MVIQQFRAESAWVIVKTSSQYKLYVPFILYCYIKFRLPLYRNETFIKMFGFFYMHR